MKTDILIIGSGCSGLYCALQLPADKQIQQIITKADLESSDSFLAQGGMCMLKSDSDYDSYFEDTMKAGHYENDKKSVDIMIRSSQDVVKDLLSYGVDFKRDEDGALAFTREGGAFYEAYPVPRGYHRKRDHKQAFSGGTEVTECDDLRTHNDGRYHLP